ncbi:hypothetical protein [Sporosarcina sp. OR05]|uniref:hypothetical protein n=1 Tax=Sporosarcina sp. OR05 TaxID=2969819 RepID=UPI00352AE373
MQLSKVPIVEGVLKIDGLFDIMAQCKVLSNQRILTFFDDIKYLDCINMNESISCVICRPQDQQLFGDKSFGIITTDYPRIEFFRIHNLIGMPNTSKKSTVIGSDSAISPSALIAKYNVQIGDNVIIEENVVIRENVFIGNNCIIRAGSVIGGQGYEFKRDKNQRIFRVEHYGSVEIEDFVEIKEFCTVHQAVFAWDKTCIGQHSKIDAHSHIAHGVKMGNRVMVGSHGNIAGNVCIKDDVYIGPGVTISNRINIEKGSRVSIGSTVTKSVDEYQVVTGNFAIDHSKFIFNLKRINNSYRKNLY